MITGSKLNSTQSFVGSVEHTTIARPSMSRPVLFASPIMNSITFAPENVPKIKLEKRPFVCMMKMLVRIFGSANMAFKVTTANKLWTVRKGV